MNYKSKKYISDVEYVCDLPLEWSKLSGMSVMITGATGLIGSFLIDVLMYRNAEHRQNCKVAAVSRGREKLEARFPQYIDSGNFGYVCSDVNMPIEYPEGADYVIHLASNTHPIEYSTQPISTITSNVIGLYNILNYAASVGARRCVFASSNEIYGENRGDVELFYEDYCGYIDCNTMRAGYPESKRCAEALCQAYIAEKHMDIVIPRFTRTYGPTMNMDDSKAVSQFIRKAIAGEDIVLKSEGLQYYSYTYVADAVAGLLYVMLQGECGEAYNIADESSDIRLRDLAEIMASYGGHKVVYEIPDSVEARGYSTATKARLDGTKIHGLGWKPKYDIHDGVYRTLDILKGDL